MTRPALDILVIDGDPWAADVLEPMLRRFGHEVRLARTEEDAVRLFADHRPNITFLDVATADSRSLDVLRHLRRQDARASIIGLTGTDVPCDLTPVRDLGVTEFLAKTASGSSVGSETTGGPPTDRPASVLIVDDEPTIAALLARFLSARGYHAEGVSSAAEALQRIEAGRPDAMLLDLFMPGMNGLELLRELRSRAFRGAVLALSAAHDDALLRRLAECGPVHVVGKPVDLDRLAVALQIALALTPPAAA